MACVPGREQAPSEGRYSVPFPTPMALSVHAFTRCQPKAPIRIRHPSITASYLLGYSESAAFACKFSSVHAFILAEPRYLNWVLQRTMVILAVSGYFARASAAAMSWSMQALTAVLPFLPSRARHLSAISCRRSAPTSAAASVSAIARTPATDGFNVCLPQDAWSTRVPSCGRTDRLLICFEIVSVFPCLGPPM